MTALLCALFLLQDVPTYDNFVTDRTGVLTSEEKDHLNAFLKSYRDQTGNEIAVLLVPSTQPSDIRTYGITVADRWKVGQQGKDNGVIFVIAVQDRTMAIEVGRGLEGSLTDLQCSYIIHEVAGFFRKTEFFNGIRHGVDSIVKAVGGEYKPPADLPKPKKRRSSSWEIWVILIVLMILLGGGRRYRRSAWGGWIFTSGGSRSSSSRGFGGFGGFGGGGFGGGGASGRW